MSIKNLAAMGMLATLLAGCGTQIMKAQPGTPVVEIIAQHGKPSYECTAKNGRKRLIWSQQPFGQYAWATEVTPEGTITEMTQVLADQHFNRMSRGIWTREDVLCEFGPPADEEQVGIPEARRDVWSYRYRQSDVWYSMMYVYFEPNGNRVIRFHSGPDPMFLEDWSAPDRH